MPPFTQPPIRLLPASPDQPIRTIPELVDYNAARNPGVLFCVQAVKDGAAVRITFAQLRDAISRCSARVRAELRLRGPAGEGEDGDGDGGGTGTGKSAPVALFMNSDAALVVHLFALMGIGVPVALISARLSPVAVAHLLRSIRARAVIASPRLVPLVEAAISEQDELAAVALHVAKPFSADLATGKDVAGTPISSPGHYVGESDRHVLILHSSGTTGLPKPIYQPHRYLLGFSRCHERTEDEEVEALNISTLPLYHGFGLVPACLALGVGKPFYIASAHTVPTGASTVAAIRSSGAQSLMTVPHILDEICALPLEEGIDALRPLQFVASAGGPLNAAVGEKLVASGVSLLAHFGTTEIGPIAPLFKPGPDYDWRFFKLREDVDLRLDIVDGYYTLTTRPFGWEEVFVLQDRLMTSERYPGKHFRAVGRNDDLIVLSTGEKVLPAVLETLLCESPLVKAACAFGEARFELGVVVEPATLATNVEQLKEAIWPVVLEAGRQMDSHARLSSKASIIVADSALPRSDKGSVVRKEAWRIFADNIELVYRQLEDSNMGHSRLALRTEALEQDLKEMLQAELGWTDDLSPEEDLFELGINSLQAMSVYRRLRGAELDGERLPAGAIPNDFLYKNSTVDALVRALKSQGAKSATAMAEEDLIMQLSRHYSLPAKEQGHVVLLTGGTGSLGSHVIAALAGNPAVAKIICLNRRQVSQTKIQNWPRKPLERQKQALLSKGLETPPHLLSKLEVLEIDARNPYFGLPTEQYTYLFRSVTHIFHAAWPMDFQRMLSSFHSQFDFLRSLLQLASDIHTARPSVRSRLIFISSIAVVGQYHTAQKSRNVPEAPMLDARSTNPFGYGKAKLVCEKMLEAAAATHGAAMEVATVRVAQVSGSRGSGFWNAKEHIPSLVRLSQRTGSLPDIHGTLSWLPVDRAADVLTDIILSPLPLALVYHLENPVRQSWHDVLAIIGAELGLGGSALSPLDQWLAGIKALGDGAASTEMLIDFFETDFQHMSGGGVVLDTTATRAVSSTLRDADVVEDELVARYVREWKRQG
ncbi:acetyl-CoA synthetase-like protein [Lentithecium fluviatile CBS 122367]|uniref:Acetyl-CoA synthetase-like protein n=1 Tax=Lentithecium fluviatile CBS 122367 TaxID=1168545 RepID=A0A6G1IBH5_9PLEO|nr:acetyl-CoA synthetase-like protein [Lentithecium fluviatile CBS 122367]